MLELLHASDLLRVPGAGQTFSEPVDRAAQKQQDCQPCTKPCSCIWPAAISMWSRKSLRQFRRKPARIWFFRYTGPLRICRTVSPDHHSYIVRALQIAGSRFTNSLYANQLKLIDQTVSDQQAIINNETTIEHAYKRVLLLGCSKTNQMAE